MAENKTIIHCCIDRGTHDMLAAHCELTGQTKTTAVKRAILAYCQANGVPDEAAARRILEDRDVLP